MSEDPASNDSLQEPINLSDFEEFARHRLSPMAYGYYASGANDELTLRQNQEAFRRLHLAYRVLVDVSQRELSTRVLGEHLAMPILVAPTAFHRLAHPDGEIATVRAAGDAGTVMILSTLSNTRVEEVVAAASGPVWFQLYVYKDRAATRALVERVEEAGCTAILLTFDAPLLGRRERDIRNRFHLPPGVRIENLHADGYGGVPAQEGDSGLAGYVGSLMDPFAILEGPRVAALHHPAAGARQGGGAAG